MCYNCTNNLCSVDVSVSVNSNMNGPSNNIFNKNFNFSFCNSGRLPYKFSKHEIINLLAPKVSGNYGNMNIFFTFLLPFNFLRNQKNDLRLRIILVSFDFFVWIFYRFSKLENRLKFCFNCQFFIHDTP